MKACPPDQAQVARDILVYLSNRPDAEDTLESIMRQLLPEKPTARQATLLKEVAADLVTQGLIVKVRNGDRILYQARSRH